MPSKYRSATYNNIELEKGDEDLKTSSWSNKIIEGHIYTSYNHRQPPSKIVIVQTTVLKVIHLLMHIQDKLTYE